MNQAIAETASRRLEPTTLGIGVSMTVGYGTLYYPFAILGPEMARDLDWSNSFVFGVFSIALLSSAITASIAGRAIDRFGARPVLVAGSLVAVATLVFLSTVASKPAFVLAMLMIEIAGRMAQYEAGFAALTAIHGAAARRHITHVTLVAGFASTIFWPLIHWLLGFMDWRGVCLVLAAVNACVALPIHALLPGKPGGLRNRAGLSATPLASIPAAGAPAEGLLPSGRRRMAFLLMAITFACGGFLMSAVHTSFFVIMEKIGRDAALAALAGAVIGPMQVGARVVELATGGRIASSVVGVVSSLGLALGLVLLFVSWHLAGSTLVIAFAVSFGIGQGLAFIARAVLPIRLFGTLGYGRITGNLAAIRMVFTGAAPFLTALVIGQAGISAAFMMLGAMALVGVVAALMLCGLEMRAATRQAMEAETLAPSRACKSSVC